MTRRTSPASPKPRGSAAVDAAATLALNVAIELASYGDVERAQAAYRLVVETDHKDFAPWASVALGILLAGQGNVRGAQHAFEKAIDSGHPDAAPEGAAALGVLMARHGHTEAARTAFQRAIDSGHPIAMPRAAASLGDMLSEQGDIQGAKAAYQRVVDSSPSDVAPTAAASLAILLAQGGDIPGAKAALQKTIDSGHPDAALAATFSRGMILAGQGNLQEAQVALQEVIDSGYPELAPRAAVNLGVLLYEHGDPEGARAAFQKAIDSGHPDWRPRATVMFGIFLDMHGDPEGARAAFQLAIDSGHADAVPRAARMLTALLAPHGNALYGHDHAAAMTAQCRRLRVLSSLPTPPTEEIDALAREIERYAASTLENAPVDALAAAGNALRQSGHPELAVNILRAAQRILVAIRDPDDVKVLLVEHNLAAAVAAQGEPAAAKTTFDELIPRMESALGTEHRLTLRARRQQALLLAGLGAPAEALKRQLTLADTWRTRCGEDSPEYAEALGDIAATYEVLRRPEDVRKYRRLQQQTGAVDDINAAGHI